MNYKTPLKNATGNLYILIKPTLRMAKTVQILCEVFTDGDKRFGTQTSVTGTGIFPASDGKFKSNNFHSMFREMCNGWIDLNLEFYLNKFDEKNHMGGFIRQMVMKPINKRGAYRIKIFVHIDGDKTNVIGLDTVRNIKTSGKFGSKAFLQNVTDAIQMELNRNVDEHLKKFTPKNQRGIRYTIHYDSDKFMEK